MLKILLLEDNQVDVERIRLELNKLREANDIKTVSDKKSYIHALQNFNPQVILSDVNMSGYSGEEALIAARELNPKVSVIIVTGTINGEEALEYVVDLGAKDYVLKSDLKRLVPAMKREYNHYKLKKSRIEQEKWLQLFSQMAHQTEYGIIVTDSTGKIEWVNEAYETITGYSLQECYEQKPGHFLKGKETDRKTADYVSAEIKKGQPVTAELLNYTKSGDTFWSKLNISPLKNSNGDIHHFIALQEDVTKKKTTLHTLEQSLQRLEWAQELGQIGDWHFNVENQEIFWSKQMFAIYGRDIQKGHPSLNNILNNYYGQDQQLHNQAVSEALENGKDFDITVSLISDENPKKMKYIRIIGKPGVDDQGRVKSLQGIVQDVTESVLMDQELEFTKKFHQLAIEGADVGLWELDLKSFKTIFNDVYYEMLGYEHKDVDFTKNFHDKIIHPEDYLLVERFMKEILEGNRIKFECTIRMKNKEGEYRYIMDRARVIEFTPDGHPSKLAGSHIDITERILTDQDLARSYKEKETLLQEIHHRVKNNLAIISGLLWLEMDSSDKTVNTLPLSRSINRIQSMGKVHELLYRSKSLSEINIKEYIVEMVDLILGNTQLPHKIQTELDIEDVEININEMVPLGLLLNELMTNSLKYAFNDSNGTIFISFWQEGDQHHLSYRDTGPGINETIDITATKTLGMKIISVLLKQLVATYAFDTENKFRLDLSFESKGKGSHSNLKA
jgi:PAS domain S-box-containing protein